MKNPFNQLTIQELYEKTIEERRCLKEWGINVVHMWECEFHQKLKEDNSLTFANEEPLNPCAAFFGGQTNAVKLWCDVTETTKKIKYRRIPIITAPVIFGFSSPKGPLLSGGRYFRVAVTFGWLENVCNSAVVLHKEDT